MTTRTLSPAGGLSRILAITGVLLAVSAAGIEAQNGDPERTTTEGVFTEEQAARGETAFDEVCAACHFSRQFRGRFMSSWTGSTIFSLYRMIRQTMPQNQPGSLSPQQYADVVAYLLEINGMPTGDSPLPSEEDALENILIERSSNR